MKSGSPSPFYNPRVVYGGWLEPDYPPYFFPIPFGFAFEPGYPIGFYPALSGRLLIILDARFCR